MTSLCEKIRAFLREKTEPLSSVDIAAGIGEVGNKNVHYALSAMSNHKGHLTKEKIGNLLHYRFAREPTAVAESNRARGYQHKVDAAKAADRALARTLRRARKNEAVKAKRMMQRMNTLAASVGRDKKESQNHERPETVEEFLARGGTIQVLHPWETSMPVWLLAESLVDLD